MIFHRFFFFLVVVVFMSVAYASYPYGQPYPQQYPQQSYPPPQQPYPQQSYPPAQYPQPHPSQQPNPPQSATPQDSPAPVASNAKTTTTAEPVSDPFSSVALLIGGGFAVRTNTSVSLEGLDVSPSLSNSKGFNFFAGVDYPLFSSPRHHVDFLYMLTKQYGTFSWSSNTSLGNYSTSYNSTTNSLLVGYAYHSKGSFIFNPFVGFNFSNPLSIPDLLKEGGGAVAQGPTFQFGFKMDIRFKTNYAVGFMYSYFTPMTYNARARLDILPEGSFYDTTLRIQGSSLLMLTLSMMVQ